MVFLYRARAKQPAGKTAGGNVGRNAFAISIAEVTTARYLLAVFKPSDLKSSHMAVYRATNGHRICSIGVSDLVPAVQTFAISPREDENESPENRIEQTRMASCAACYDTRLEYNDASLRNSLLSVARHRL